MIFAAIFTPRVVGQRADARRSTPGRSAVSQRSVSGRSPDDRPTSFSFFMKSTVYGIPLHVSPIPTYVGISTWYHTMFLHTKLHNVYLNAQAPRSMQLISQSIVNLVWRCKFNPHPRVPSYDKCTNPHTVLLYGIPLPVSPIPAYICT